MKAKDKIRLQQKIEEKRVDKFSDNLDDDIDSVISRRTELQGQIAQIQINSQRK